jgi:hypothetical protein
MVASDLENFGAGAAEGMKQTFELADAVKSTYSLGRHSFWIERAKGTPEHHPENPFTFEIACTLLEKGAACWMTMATDEASLRAFEQGVVQLEDDTPATLVPPDAVPATPPKKPS